MSLEERLREWTERDAERLVELLADARARRAAREFGREVGEVLAGLGIAAASVLGRALAAELAARAIDGALPPEK